MLSPDDAWQRMLECEYNRRHYVRQLHHYARLSVCLEWLVVFLSSVASVAFISGLSPLVGQSVAVLTAALATFLAVGRFAIRSGKCEAQAVLWTKLVHAFHRLHQRHVKGETIEPSELATLDFEFSHLDEQDQHPPNKKIDDKIYNEVLRSYGYPSSELA